MEPDKSYPLHSDDRSQPGASPTPSVNDKQPPLEAPSRYGRTKDTPMTQPDATPWYLRPLTKAPQSPLTSAQTRPYVPRQPLPLQSDGDTARAVDESRVQPVAVPSSEPAEQPAIHAPPMSPFRSPSVAPSPVRPQLNDAPADSILSVGRFRMPARPKQAAYQQALSGAIPKPFSQYGAQPPVPSTPSQPTQSGKLRKWVGILLVVLLIGGIGTAAYSLWRNNASQPDISSTTATINAKDKLYQAIDNHLKTSKIRQVFDQTVTATEASNVKIDATSDFSDPRIPKSHIKYELKIGAGEAASDGAGELIIQNSNDYYGRLAKPALFYEGDDSLKPKEGQWYTLPVADSTGVAAFDPLSVRTSINSSLGEFPVGNFSDDTRRQLMQYIKQQDVYAIKSDEQVEVDGVKMTHYTLDVSAEHLNELNKKVYVAMGGNPDEMPVDFSQSATQNVELWVNDESTKIAKITINRESAAGEGGTVKENTIVNILYPNEVPVIAKPENPVAVPTR